MKLSIRTTDIPDHNILEVAAGTNCDETNERHDARTYFKIKDAGGTTMHYRIDGNSSLTQLSEIEMVFRGHSERDTLIEALEFILESIRPKPETNSTIDIP